MIPPLKKSFPTDFSDYARMSEDLGKRYPQIHLVYLFGSQAGGDVGPLSDIDLAFARKMAPNAVFLKVLAH